MSGLSRKRRWGLLAAGLVASAGLGTTLGRAWERHTTEAPAAPSSDGEEAGLAESLDLEPPAAAPQVPPTGGRPSLEGLGKTGRTGQAALRSRMPRPAGAGAWMTMGEETVAHGVPMQLAAFETTARAAEVLAFYARHFESRGWPYSDVPGARGLVDAPALSATLLDEGLQLTVMVLAHEEGCTVVVGQADMDAALQGGLGEDMEDLPAWPDTHPVVVRARGEGLADLTVSFDTPAPLSQVEAFYRQALVQRGYVLGAEAPEASGQALHLLSFSGRAGRHWTLALSSEDGRTALTAHGTHPQEPSP